MQNSYDDKCVIASTANVQFSKLGFYSRVKDYTEVRDTELGDYSYISQFSIVNKTKIGRFTSIASGCYIGLWEHDTEVSTHSFYRYESSGGFVSGFKNYKSDYIWTHVGSDVWIGANTVILKGVKIGDGAIIGAGSVVVRDVEPYAIVVGSPARELRKRIPEDEIRYMLAVKWWDLPRNVLQALVDLGAFESMHDFLTSAEKIVRGKATV